MKKLLKYSLITAVVVFVIANILIANHAYKFSHYVDGTVDQVTASTVTNKSGLDKLKLMLVGIDLPRPATNIYPNKYSDIQLNLQDGKLSGWMLKTDSTRQGTVLMFHGYKDEKSAMLTRAEEIRRLGFDVVIMDFIGSADSSGSSTTIGYREAENVAQTYTFLPNDIKKSKIILFGFSMGATAVMKAMNDYQLDVDGIVLEAPFATFEGTIESRCQLMGAPRQPTAALFSFWFGIVNGFNAFSYNPIEYAHNIHTPTLLMCGKKDQYVSPEETQSIFDAIASQQKTVHLFENSTHESYLLKHKDEWLEVISNFLLNQTNRTNKE